MSPVDRGTLMLLRAAGSISGSVTTTQGDAHVTARQQVTGSVSAGRDAHLLAVGSISSNPAGITAARDAYVTTYGELSAEVTATGGHAFVSAGLSIAAEVTAMLDAQVAARTGEVTKNITSQTGSVELFAGGQISGEVVAHEHADVVSLASVSGNVTATTGDATVAARGGELSGNVTAGRSASVYALDDISGTISAAADAVVTTLAKQIGNVAAGRDALLWAADHRHARATNWLARLGSRLHRRQCGRGDHRCRWSRRPFAPFADRPEIWLG